MHIVLAEREAELMAVLWEHGPSTVTEVRDRVGDELAYTTVLTMLRKLEAKGYVAHQEHGRAHRFSATIAPEAARHSALRDLVRKMFKGSTELLLTHAVADERLTEEQLRRIRRLLKRTSAKGAS
jgi:predicted transcriptional regulator